MKYLVRILDVIFICLLANIVLMEQFFVTGKIGILILVILFLWICIMPSIKNRELLSRRLRICADGCELLKLFSLSTVFTVAVSICGIFTLYHLYDLKGLLKITCIHLIVATIVEALVFWNGIIRVYLTSEQLGIKLRVIGILCGWIPGIHLVTLGIIMNTVSKEIKVENEKLILNEQRKQQAICKTKYPILMVHGVFFRDFRYLNYWGRIPRELEKNGAVLYYGNQQSADSVENCGKELADRIKTICRECHCDKVNIIAHSKGGLDCRYALSLEGVAEHVASLTTINTPHRGCEFADYLLSKIPEKQKNALAKAYNTGLKKVGDPNPDFIKAVNDLTASSCRERNEWLTDAEGVYYQSVGSKLNHAGGGRFPLNFSYYLVGNFDGPNDGLVGMGSCEWGERFQFLTVKGRRGLSHGDMIDLNRENFAGFDVREFFVQLVADLKQRGF